MKQSIYDDETFFEGYRAIRSSRHNYNDLLEQPAMADLLVDVAGMDVLDLGCGYGKNCMDFIRRGAKSVVGIDLSAKMLDVARRDNSHAQIAYVQMDMAEAGGLGRTFDLVYSSLAFHYVEDFDGLIAAVYHLLRPGGVLLFSQEHPVVTATEGYASHWNYDGDGQPVSYTFSNYNQPGVRKSHWFVDNVVTYHRTMGQIVTTLARRGFIIEAMDETAPKPFAVAAWPELEKEYLKPNFLIIRAKKR